VKRPVQPFLQKLRPDRCGSVLVWLTAAALTPTTSVLCGPAVQQWQIRLYLLATTHQRCSKWHDDMGLFFFTSRASV